MLALVLLSLLPSAATEVVTPLFVLGPPLRSLAASVVKVESRTTTYEVACPPGPDKDPNCPRGDFWPPATVYVGPGNVVGGAHTGRIGVGATTSWECNVAGGDNHALCRKTIVGPPPDLTITASTTLGGCDIAHMSVAAVVTAGQEKLLGSGATGGVASLYSSLQSKASGLGCAAATDVPATTSGADLTTAHSGGSSSGEGTPTGTNPTATSPPNQTTPNRASHSTQGYGGVYMGVGAAIAGLLAFL